MKPDIDTAVAALIPMATTYGLRVVGALVLLTGGWMVARLVYRLIERAGGRFRNVDRTLVMFLSNVARYAVLVMTFIAVLTTFGIATTSFIAVLGAMGLAVGLALQGTLSHFAAGIMLIILRPYHIDDTIETANVSGTIRIINVFYTELETPDGTRVIIPNGKLWGEIVKVPNGLQAARVTPESKRAPGTKPRIV
jgi:small conductance mechanosensitive channel